ncbi:Single-stranded DNA-binding protein [Smittium culicis]|uniref:Single-stranded DNA-binding protein n=1 Tax=Smittium culicis TaxID=133412 RepID=A0A1R1YMF6_9FUNG|nr:Single-stranded DNA-binding protein [Smittium culicis]
MNRIISLNSARKASAFISQTRCYASLNKVILVGNVGQDPEISTFGEDKKKAKFSLATSFKFKDKEGNVLEKTSWHNISVYSKLAENVEKLVKKGATVHVEGKIDYHNYTNKTGNEIYRTEIIADKFTVFKYPKKTEETESEDGSSE